MIGYIVMGLGSFIYLLSICKFFNSETYKFLSTVISHTRILIHIHWLRVTKPVIKFHMTCYHYRRRKGKRRKIITLKKSQEFKFEQVEDSSQPENDIEILKKEPLCRFYFTKQVVFTPDMSNKYQIERSQFEEENTQDRY